MLGSGCISRDEWKVDLGFHRGGEFHLGFFSGFFEPLEGHFVLGNVDASIFFKFCHKPVLHVLIDVIPT
ncbi:hypothetical protein ES703_118311 [subsurface metagenome]